MPEQTTVTAVTGASKTTPCKSQSLGEEPRPNSLCKSGDGGQSYTTEKVKSANVYVPANLRAHVFQDDMHEWDTTVIAFRIDPEFDTWPIPILIDTTDSEAQNVFVFIEDQSHWTSVGDVSCDDLDAARRYVKDILERRPKRAEAVHGK